MNRVLKLTILGGLSAAATLGIAGQMPSNSQGDGSVQDAIRFEKAKDAADARQAAIEAGRAQQGGTTGRESSQQPKVESGVQEAIRFERAKDAADARQARIESQRAAASNNAVGNADRRANGQK